MKNTSFLNEALGKTAIYFDMDGVLAKWCETATQEEVNSAGYFLNRDVENVVLSLINFMISIGLNIRFLSAVYQNGYAEKEKGLWLDKIGLPEEKVGRIFVPYGEDKNNYIKEDKAILIDDFGKNLEAWRLSGKGRRAIKFYNGINNRPKMTFDEDGHARLRMDSWNGASINKDMTVEDMFSVIVGQALLA